MVTGAVFCDRPSRTSSRAEVAATVRVLPAKQMAGRATHRPPFTWTSLQPWKPCKSRKRPLLTFFCSKGPPSKRKFLGLESCTTNQAATKSVLYRAAAASRHCCRQHLAMYVVSYLRPSTEDTGARLCCKFTKFQIIPLPVADAPAVLQSTIPHPR